MSGDPLELLSWSMVDLTVFAALSVMEGEFVPLLRLRVVCWKEIMKQSLGIPNYNWA